ncbi:MAG: P-II family nitrogen regulator [Rhodothermales bacterium]
MRYYKIHAYVRNSVREDVEKVLLKLGVDGFTFYRVKGVGEYANYFSRLHHVEHTQFEVFVTETDVDLLIDAIVSSASTPAKGDGLIAVMPVDRVVRIRNHAELDA